MEHPEGELPKRTITRVSKLYDVGPVTFPAYEDTTVSARCREAVEPKEVIPVSDPHIQHTSRRRRLEGKAK